jgi:two-component system sensor histidine kinase QseC
MTTQRLSIQSRLILLMLGSLLAVELVTGWTGYQRAIHEADGLLDAQLTQYAQILLSLANEGEDDEVKLPDIVAHPYQSKLMFQIWDMKDAPRIMLRSPGAPRQWPEGVRASGYSETILAGHAWRFFAAKGPDEHVVLAAHDLHIREELAREIALSNMAPYLVAVPILALLLLLAIRHSLEPLHALASDLAGRDPGHLEEVQEAGLPRELRPPVRAINQLFGRIRRVMDKERRFTSDAAHELRTPIAALCAQLQVAERTPDPEERQAAIAKALHGANRMTHLVTQLLSLARLEAASADKPDVEVNLSDLLQDVVAGVFSQSKTKGIQLQADIERDGVITGNSELLRVLLRNLIDNALRYMPEGEKVRVGLALELGRVVLMVEDSGPGVAMKERDKLGLRFHRFGNQTIEGVGLGLSIVRRIAELHGAELTFGDGLEGRGLGVRVSFPARD